MKKSFLTALGLAAAMVSTAQIPTTNLIKEYFLSNGNLENNVSPGTNDLVPTGSARQIIADPIGTASMALNLNGDNFSSGTRGNTGGVGNGDMSLSFWINTTTNSATSKVIFEQQGSSGFGPYGWSVELVNGKVTIYNKSLLNGAVVSGQVSAETNILSDGNWHHVVAKVKKHQFWSGGWAYGPQVSIYLDNALQNSQQTGGASNLSLIYINPIAEEVYMSKAGTDFSENVDNIRVYNYNLGTADILALYNEYAADLTTLYVDKDASGSNNGSSWSDAYTDLQTALAAFTDQEIWIAEGTYTPHATDRTISFNIPAKAHVYGGFNGTETALSQRNWNTNKTILSGDLIGNDAGTIDYDAAVRSENSLHVIQLPGDSTVLDGLTIADGHANGASFDCYGAGVYANYTSKVFTIKNCNFKHNVGRYGVGFFSRFDTGTLSVKVENTTFNDNLGNTGTGFYVYPHTSGTLNVDVNNCLFYNNEATDLSAGQGGGGSAFMVYGFGSGSTTNLQVTNCTFSKNKTNATHANLNSANRSVIIASRRSGALHSNMDNCIFWGNTQLGGGTAIATATVFDSDPHTLTAENSIDEDGFSTIAGGSQTNTSSVDPLFANMALNNFNLTCSSPAVDAADSTGLGIPMIDAAGNNRYVSTLDMGALEFLNPHTSITAQTQDATAYLDGAGSATITPADVDNNSGTTCGTAFSLSLDVSSFNCSNLGTNTVQLTATETVGGANHSASATVTILDTLAPTVVTQDISVQLDAGGSATITIGQIDNGTADNCGAPTLTISKSTFDCSNYGPNTVMLYAEDASGNIDSASATVTLQDLIEPIAIGQNYSVQLDLSGSVTVSTDSVDNGSSDNCNFTLALSQATFGCTDLGDHTVDLIATDAAGNDDTVQVTITILPYADDVTPVANPGSLCNSGDAATITIPSSNIGLEYYLRDNSNDAVIDGPISGTGSSLDFNTGAVSATTTYNIYAEQSSPTGAVNLDGVNDVISMTNSMRGISTQMTVSCWVKTTSVGVSQIIAGKYNGISGFLLYFNASGQVLIDGRDNTGVYKSSGASTTVITDGQWHHIAGTINISTGVWSIYVDGTIESFNTNAAGNTLTNTSALYFGTTSNPVNYYAGDIDLISLWNVALTGTQVNDIMTNCLTGNEANIVGLYHLDENTGTMVSDQSPSAISAGLINMDPNTDWVAGTPNLCQVADPNCAVEMTQTVTLNVGDITGPVADVATLSDINAQCEVTSLTAPTATDNCAGSITGTHNTTLPITASTTVTWTYDDGNGNSTTQDQSVVIHDNTAPVADVATLSDINEQCEVTSLTAPTATDNCAGTITGTHNATLPISASTTVTWTYDDGNGNTVTQDQSIVINDNTAPVADVTSLTDVTAQCEVTSLTAPTAADNCAGSITGTHNASLPITASTTVTWTYDDGNGNTSTQDQAVVINDNTAPVADVASLTDLTASCEITTLTTPTATDNCLGVITGTHNATLPITASTTVTWTYDDGNGNTSTQDQAVIINDVTAPSLDSTSLVAITAQCEITSLSTPTATDNCAGSILGTHNATLPITSSMTITWTYDDGNGNTVTQDQTVTISDTEAPVADVASLTDVTSECEVTSLTAPTATDNCSGTITGTHNATLPISSNTTVTWTYTDGAGNSITQDQNVVIDDVTAPVLDSTALTTLTDACEIASLTAPTATDNCTGSVTGTHNATLPITADMTITWTFTDNDGNSTTQTQDVVISGIDNSVTNSNGELTANGTADQYQWLDCNNGFAVINGASSATFQPTENGSYAVQLTVGNCVDTSACENITTIGITENDGLAIKAYPNPLNDQLTISTNANIVQIQISNALGQEVMKSRATTIDVSHLERGMYLVQVQTDQGQKTIQVLKQ